MHTTDHLARMNADELRQFAAQLISEITDTRRELGNTRRELTDTRQDNTRKQLKIDQLTHEMAILKRWKFVARSEQLHGEQRHLFEETVEADLEALGLELQALQQAEARKPVKDIPKRAALPASLPRTEIRHEPEHTTCACGCQMKRIGEDVAEKLDYTPGVFSVERHIRGKWVCTTCHTITQAVSVRPSHLDRVVTTADDRVHLTRRWTPWHKSAAGHGGGTARN